MPKHLEREQAWLMRENQCFSYKKSGHTNYECPKKEKIAAISKIVD